MEYLELLVEIAKYYKFEISIIGIIVVFFFIGYGVSKILDNDD